MIMLHPPEGVGSVFVGPTGHNHDGPTDCEECASVLVGMDWIYAETDEPVAEVEATDEATEEEAKPKRTVTRKKT